MSSSPAKPVLHSYWRSSCSWRIRIALALKGIEYEYRAVNLLQNQQNDPDYVSSKNPGALVPTLEVDGVSLTQSMAILEFLEDRFPDATPLLPKDPVGKARVRALAQMVVSDIQPVQNLRVLKYVSPDDPEKRIEWGRHWVGLGLASVERALAKTAGRYCFGDAVTLADACLVPQCYNAVRFGVDMTQFPTIQRVLGSLEELAVLKAAHPDSQPDAPNSD